MSIIKRYFDLISKTAAKNPRLWAATVFGALSIIYIVRTWTSTRSDFHAYYFAAENALKGLSPYNLADPTPFKYLPVTAFFFIPYTLFKYKFALLFFLCTLLIATFHLYREIFIAHGGRAVALLAICLYRFHNQDLANHQVNSLLLILFLFFLRARETSSMILGCAAFALFTSFKLTPLLLLWPLFWMQRWRELSLIGIFLVVINFLPLAFFSQSGLVYKEWFDLISSTTEQPAPTAANIQSLASMIWFYCLKLNVSAELFRIGWVGVAGVFALIIAFSSKKARSVEDQIRVLCATLAISVLLNPLAWKHSYLQLLPLLIVWYREGRMQRLFAFFVLTTLLPALIALISKEAADRSYILVLSVTYFAVKTLLESSPAIKDSRSKSESDTCLHPHAV